MSVRRVPQSSRTVVGLLVWVTIAGCGGGTAPTAPSLSGDASLADLKFCVDETNRYRALAGFPAVTRSTDIEGFAAAAAASDSQSNVADGYFTSQDPGSAAENEVIDWPIQTYGSVHGVVQQALAAFWSEGPTGEHYLNLMGAFTSAGCGVNVTVGLITFAQDFR